MHMHSLPYMGTGHACELWDPKLISDLNILDLKVISTWITLRSPTETGSGLAIRVYPSGGAKRRLYSLMTAARIASYPFHLRQNLILWYIGTRTVVDHSCSRL